MKRRTFALGAAAAVAGSMVPLDAYAAPPTLTIQPWDRTTCPVDPHFAKHQMRGLWIASVVNIDWPSRTGLTAEKAQAELIAYLDLAVERRYRCGEAVASWRSPGRLAPSSTSSTASPGSAAR